MQCLKKTMGRWPFFIKGEGKKEGDASGEDQNSNLSHRRYVRIPEFNARRGKGEAFWGGLGGKFRPR